jgi:alkanesulfonate monooxygenase SsuD/methylene tetrahydromethanopterin reductase-like flavin-dependent oxidoreductase (luciferase family)
MASKAKTEKAEEKGETHAQYESTVACLFDVGLKIEEKRQQWRAAQFKPELDKLAKEIKTLEDRRTNRLAEPRTDRLSKVTCAGCAKFLKHHPIMWTAFRSRDIAVAAETGEHIPTLGELKEKEYVEYQAIEARKAAAKATREYNRLSRARTKSLDAARGKKARAA